jgi:hypothetical protein
VPAAGGRDSAATRRQLMSDRATDASGGAGNKDASTFQSHAHTASFGDSRPTVVRERRSDRHRVSSVAVLWVKDDRFRLI